MNSMSQNRGCQSGNCNPCRPCNPCNPCNPCKPCKPCNPCNPCNPCSFQNCACGNIGPLSVTITAPFVPQFLNFPIVNVSENNNNCHCFRVNFLGSLTLSSTAAPATVNINYTLYKSCTGNGPRQPIAFFASTTNIVGANIPQTQNLTFESTTCRCGNERSCNYSLELTSVTSTVVTTLNISIFGILCVQGLNNRCCC